MSRLIDFLTKLMLVVAAIGIYWIAVHGLISVLTKLRS